jgi:RNA polymerase sigma-70 factor, ECF subfamily
MSHMPAQPHPNIKTVEDANYLKRLRKKDPEACALCVQEHSDAIYRLGLRMLRNENEAEDLVQETFLNAYRNIERFEGRSALGTWLFRIAYNNALMHLRKKRPEEVSVDEPVSDENNDTREIFDFSHLPEEEALDDEVRYRINSAVDAMPATLRGTFQLREIEGFSTEETAKILEVSIDVIKTRLHRARLWLRNRLADYFSERMQDGVEKRA